MRQWERSRHVILVEGSREETAAAQRRMLALLHRNYCCAALMPATVNGLPCEVVQISPRPGHAGPSRLLWIERQRHAILRTEEFDTTGARRYLSFFETFRYIRPPKLRLFALPSGIPACRVRQALRDRPDFQAAVAGSGLSGRLPAWLPPGYALLGCAACGGPIGQRSVLLRYSDGLEMISVLETSGHRSDARSWPGCRTWVREMPPLCVSVIGDDTLPSGMGQDILLALEPRTGAALRQGITRAFGPSAQALAVRLRRQGWGYDRIAALCLGRRSLGTPAQLERRARRWIALTLGNHTDHSR